MMTFHANKPDEIELTLTLTMTLDQWKRLKEQIPHEWPSSDIKSKIYDLVRQAERHFYTRDLTNPPKDA
jgi:hypothetical protein